MLKISLIIFVILLTSCNTVSEKIQPDKSTIETKKQDDSHLNINNNIVINKPIYKDDSYMFKLLSAEIAGRRGLMDYALAGYLDVAQSLNSPEIAERAAIIAASFDDDEIEENAANIWLDISPNNIDALKMLFSVNLRKNNLKKSVDIGQTIYQLSEDKSKALRIISATILLEKNTKIAVPLVKRFIKQYKNNADLYFVLAKLYYEKVKRIPSLNAINKTLQLDPSIIDAYIIKSALLYEQNDGSAIVFLQQAIKKHPKATKLRLALLRFLIDDKKYATAGEHLEAVYDLSKNDATILFKIALLAVETDQYSLAKKYFTRTIKLGEYLQSSNYYLGRMASNDNQHQLAIDYYSQVNSGAHKSGSQFRIVEALVLLNKPKKALEYIAALKQNYKKNANKKLELQLLEGQLLRSTGQFEQSYQVLSKASKYHPESIELLYSKALSADRLSKHHEFETDLKKILKKHPNNAQALNALGYYLVSKTQRFEEAEKLVYKAFKINPNDPAIIDTIGWLHFKQGEIEKAEKWLSKANALVFDPEISAHMGEIYWVLGKKEKAKAVWKKAIEHFPTDLELIETIKRFNVKF